MQALGRHMSSKLDYHFMLKAYDNDVIGPTFWEYLNYAFMHYKTCNKHYYKFKNMQIMKCQGTFLTP